MIYCLGFTGVPLNEATRRTLKDTACAMYDRQEKSMKIEEPFCEGRMQSDFEYTNIGSHFGIFFTADIEVEAGKTRVRFIMHNCDLVREKLSDHFSKAEKAAWN